MSNSNRPKCQPAYIRDASWEIRDHLNALERYIDDLEGKLLVLNELNAGLEVTVEALNPVLPAGELTVPTPAESSTESLTDDLVANPPFSSAGSDVPMVPSRDLSPAEVSHQSAEKALLDECQYLASADIPGAVPSEVSASAPLFSVPSPPVIIATGGRPPKTQTPSQAKAVSEHYVQHGTAKSALLGSSIGVSQAMAFRWLKDLAAATGLDVSATETND